MKKILLNTILIISLVGCATKNTSNARIPNKNIKNTVIPSGKNYNWRYLGKNNQYEVTDELDENSITKTASNQYSFRERKMFNSSSLHPEGFSINKIEINCLEQNFHITQSDSYNRQGVLLHSDKANNITFDQIVKNSFAFSQYQYVCQNKSRTIGY